MQLFQISSTPLTFQISFLAFIFLFTRIICFIAFFDMFLVLSCLSCFQHVFSLDLCSFMLVHMFICLNLHAQGFYAMFYAQIYIFSCLYVQIYMLRVLCHVSFVSFLSLFCVDVRVMCSHASYHVYGYALLESMCLYAFRHILCLDLHPYMLICLDSCSSMSMRQLSHAYTCCHAYAQIYVYVLRSMFSCACVLGSTLCLLYAIFHVLVCSMPCLCAQAQAMFVLSCAILALLLLYLSFLCFGLLVWTQSRPYGLCHCTYTLAHIKGFGSSLFTCLCLLASMFYVCVILSCSRFCHI